MTNAEILQLYDHIQSLGLFGDTLPLEELQRMVYRDKYSFMLATEVNFGEKHILKICAYFCKVFELGTYFLQKYQITDHLPSDPTNEKSQTFYMHMGISVNLSEAFNLLQGRAVFKEIASPEEDQYFAWILLNFHDKEPDGNFKITKYRSNGYDLEKILSNYPIVEMYNSDLKASIIKSLKNGNRREVTFRSVSGKCTLKYIEANPTTQSIRIYTVPKVDKRK